MPVKITIETDPAITLSHQKELANQFKCKLNQITGAWLKAASKLETQTKNNPKEAYSAGFWLPNQQILFEQIEGQKFAQWNYTKNHIDIVDSIIVGDTKYLPIPTNEVTWFLPPKPSTRKFNKNHVWNAIKHLLKMSIELQDEKTYTVLTAWIFATQLTEAHKVVAYLIFHGMLNTGKSRSAETILQMCFRGKLLCEYTAASIKRSIDSFHCTTGLDESESLKQDYALPLISILNGGYKRSTSKIELCDPNNGNKIVSMDAFGYKIICGTEQLVVTLRSRAIPLQMLKKTGKVDDLINEKHAAVIRSEMLKYRLQELASGRYEPAAVKETDAKLIEGFYDETPEVFHKKTRPADMLPEAYEGLDGRVRELFANLYAVTDDEAEQRILLECAKNVDHYMHTVEASSVQGEVLLALLLCETRVEGGFIGTKDIRETYNQFKEQNDKLSDKKICSILEDDLGIPRDRTNNKRGFVWDIRAISRACMRFGFKFKVSEGLQSYSNGEEPEEKIASDVLVTQQTQQTTSKNDVKSKLNVESASKTECANMDKIVVDGDDGLTHPLGVSLYAQIKPKDIPDKNQKEIWIIDPIPAAEPCKYCPTEPAQPVTCIIHVPPTKQSRGETMRRCRNCLQRLGIWRSDITMQYTDPQDPK